MTYLKFFRIEKGLTKKAVAKETRIPPSDYANIEDGKLKPWKPQAERLEKFFKVSISSLLEEMPFPPELKNGRIQWLRASENRTQK